MTNLALIGIDPGVSGGGISILENGKLLTFRMPESFQEIYELLKPFGGVPGDNRVRCSVEELNLRPNQNPFINARMEPLRTNYNRVQDALKMCNIPFQLVSPRTWQKFHNLVLPKGTYEKGIEIEDLKKLQTDLKHLQIHSSIESKVPNHEIVVGEIRHILETSNRLAARKALCDNYAYFSKYDLNLAIKETEKEIEKFKNQEKRIRKTRYKHRASEIAGRKLALWESDSTLLLLYQKYN